MDVMPTKAMAVVSDSLHSDSQAVETEYNRTEMKMDSNWRWDESSTVDDEFQCCLGSNIDRRLVLLLGTIDGVRQWHRNAAVEKKVDCQRWPVQLQKYRSTNGKVEFDFAPVLVVEISSKVDITMGLSGDDVDSQSIQNYAD